MDEAKADIILLVDYLAMTPNASIPPSALEKPFGMPAQAIARTPNAVQRLYATRAELAQLIRPLTIRHLRINQSITQLYWRSYAGPNSKPPSDDNPPSPASDESTSLTHFRFKAEFQVASYLLFFSNLLFLLSATLLVLTMIYQLTTQVHYDVEGQVSNWHASLKEQAGFYLPLLYGGLGASIFGISCINEARANRAWDERTTVQAFIGIPIGAISGLTIGQIFGAPRMPALGLAFLIGYVVPAALERLLRRKFAPATGAFDFLRPINLLTHIISGAALALVFLLCWGLLLPTSFPWFNDLSVALPLPPRISIVPVIAFVGGSLGAWSHVTFSILAFGKKSPGGRMADVKVPVPFLQYFIGAIAGFVVAVILPGSILSAGTNLDVFNPFALAVIAVLSGFWANYSLRSIVGSVDQLVGDQGVAAVEEGVRRALMPAPLVNYSGRMTIDVLRADTLDSCMSSGKAILSPQITDYLLNLRFEPDALDDAASIPVAIDNGIEGEAVFDIEIIADGFNPRQRRVQITTRSLATTASEPLRYTLADASKVAGNSRFRMTVSQRGRVIQFAALDILPATAL